MPVLVTFCFLDQRRLCVGHVTFLDQRSSLEALCATLCVGHVMCFPLWRSFAALHQICLGSSRRFNWASVQKTLAEMQKSVAEIYKSSTNKAPQSHSKLYPHLINEIQSELSVGGVKGNVEITPKSTRPNCTLARGFLGRFWPNILKLIQGVSKKQSFAKLSVCRSCCQLGRNTYDLHGKSANAQFGKTQFFLRHPV